MTTAADPAIYPAPRKRLAGGTELAADTSIIAPRSRIFPFYARGTLNRRQTWSTPRLIGPAIITELAVHGGGPSDPPVSTFELGTAQVPVTENAVALTTPRAWTTLFELLDPFALITATGGDGFPFATSPGNLAYQRRELKLPILDPEFFLVLSFFCNAATTTPVTGHVVVLEGVDREALRFFQ